MTCAIASTAADSPGKIAPGNALFSLIGFTGIYFVLGLLYVYLVGREVAHGPEAAHGPDSTRGATHG